MENMSDVSSDETLRLQNSVHFRVYFCFTSKLVLSEHLDVQVFTQSNIWLLGLQSVVYLPEYFFLKVHN